MKTSKTDSLKPYMTPPEIAELLRASPEKLLRWIRKAELKAVNVRDGLRPRYRLRCEDLDEFLRSRKVHPPATRATRARRHPLPREGGSIDSVLVEKILKKGQAKKVGNHYFRIWNWITQYV